MRFLFNTLVPGQTSWVVAGAVLYFLSLFILTGQVRAADRQIIQVNFVFEEDLLALTAENRAQIKARVEEKVCTLAEKRWGFLDWSNSSPAAADAARWNITFKVESRQVSTDSGGTTVGFIGTLKHSGLLAAEKFAFEQTEENETIYPMGRSIPTQDAVALSDDIAQQLDRQLGSLFESWEVKAYLKKIPIVKEVIADAPHTRVVVPVKIRDLRTEGDSVLVVKFKNPGNHSGRLELETAGEVPEDGQYKGYVIGRITDLSLFPINISTPTWWDDQLLSVIDSAREVRVYMISYSPSLAGTLITDGEVVFDPDM